MKIKEEIKQIKTEFQNDEKMLESAFRIEIFLKKNKKWILGVLLLGFVGFLGFQGKQYWEEKRALEISELFDEIIASEDELQKQELYKKLQIKGPQLYELLVFTEALQDQDREKLKEMQDSTNSFIANYARYELASLTQKFENVEYGDFKNLVLLQEGYLLAINKEHQKAIEKLNAIEPTSELKEWALRIEHYGISF